MAPLLNALDSRHITTTASGVIQARLEYQGAVKESEVLALPARQLVVFSAFRPHYNVLVV